MSAQRLEVHHRRFCLVPATVSPNSLSIALNRQGLIGDIYPLIGRLRFGFLTCVSLEGVLLLDAVLQEGLFGDVEQLFLALGR